MKNIIVLTILSSAFLTIGCVDKRDHYGMGTTTGAPDTTPHLSEMALPTAIQTKYTRLQLACDVEYSVTKKQNSWTEINTEHHVLWDLLADPATEKTVTGTFGNGDVHIALEMKLKLSLIDGNFQLGDVRDAVSLSDAALLSGASEINVSGDNVLETNSGPVTLADRVPSVLENGSHGITGGDKVSNKITCVLDAEVKKDFESDYMRIDKSK